MIFNVLTVEISHETNSFSLHKTGKRAFILRFAPMAKHFLNCYLHFFDFVLVYSIMLMQTSTTHHEVSYRS